MSGYIYLTVDTLITSEPCVLHSITVTPDAATVADVTLYDGAGAETGHELLVVRTASGCSQQVRFDSLRLSRGLYVDVGSNVACVTVEWEPVGYPKDGQSNVSGTLQ